MKHKKGLAATLALCVSLTAGGASVLAFSDVKDEGQKMIVDSLHSKGIVNGVTADLFRPDVALSEPQGVQLIVNAFGLKNEYAAASAQNKISPTTWYADAVQAATQNGLSIPVELNPQGKMTREQFAILLLEGINTTGEYPVIMLYNDIKDENKIGKDAKSAVQNLLNMDIIELDKDGNFRPDQSLTRMEAASMIFNALEFVDKHGNGGSTEPTPTNPGEGQQAIVPTVTSTKVDDKTVKVKLSAQMPHPGYGLKIEDVKLEKDGRAIVLYTIIQPDPDMMYPMVITDVTAETDIPTGYTAEAQPSGK
ncbi:S-layer homology domain-containing protein [Paenibacillus sp. F6_3S_P_1C]|uniref:S-layer homology domain-containing protein n=1 Tax=Paenibacillus vandeheii TaxID=3035917 RepID=A0ABT8J5G3_9BACL|nr:S-layer homology domain-containing protein [Paenibacillus vandeheii]MDN4600326.1 S-layer homology domain-containing protein [Paenibacillus vandeheii]